MSLCESLSSYLPRNNYKVSMAKLLSKISTISHFSIFFVITVLQKVVSIFSTPFFAKHFTPENYGVISLSQSISAISVIVIFFGTSDYIYQQALGKKANYLNNVKSIFLFQAVVVVISLIVLYGAYSFGVSEKEMLALVTAQLITFASSSYLLYMQAEFSSLTRYVLISLITMFLPLILSIYVVLTGHGFHGYVMAQLFGSFISFAISTVILSPHFKNALFSFDVLLSSFSLSIPFFFHSFAHWGRGYSDRLVMSLFFSKLEMGLFYMVLLYSSALLFSMEPFKILNNRRIYRVLESKEESNHNKIICLSALGYTAIGCFMVVAGPFVFKLLLPPEYSVTTEIIPYLVSSILFFLVYLNLITFIFYLNKNALIAKCTIIVSVVCIGASYFLVKSFGLEGLVYSFFLFNILYSAASVVLFEIHHSEIKWNLSFCFLLPLLPIFLGSLYDGTGFLTSRRELTFAIIASTIIMILALKILSWRVNASMRMLPKH